MNDLNEAELIEMAKCAEQSEMYEELAWAMKKVVNEGKFHLSFEERILLANGYKNKISSKRAAWRVLNELENLSAAEKNTQRQKALEKLRLKIEQDIYEISQDLLVLLYF